MSDGTAEGPGAGGIVGLAVVARAACGAGPILAFLGGVTVLGIAGSALFGVAAAIVAVVAAALFLVVRRRRTTTSACASALTTEGPVLLTAPARQPGDGGNDS